MSERYGTPGELKERFEDLEDWLRNEIEETENVHRYAAFRDVLDFILVGD